ncbi:MAG: adenine phosphoribosyltransferase [Candidatus Methanomethylophilaceae archaeon]|jgi:adenine phosphoribosyltransferase|nr:adenine phosphoribosyltransferase [Candidatus Methanomethylophilaceae archaeon]MBR4216586.1 adenine phosphoribosyltransferase [Candidatus Methanomethylophilaceae archaeon]
MTYPRLERCFLESTVKDVNGYSYFQNPISDGVPRVDPEILEEAIEGLAGILPEDIDLILAPEAMGIPLGAGLSLKTRIPYVVVRKKSYGLPGEIEVLQKTGYSKSRMFVNGVRKGMRVVIVDDVLDTGGTLRAISDAVKSTGADLVKIMVVYSMCEDLDAMSEKLGAPIECLVRIGMDGPRPFLRRRARTATR